MRSYFTFFIMSVLMLGLAACTKLGFLAVNAPTYHGNLMVVNQDIGYGIKPFQKLDIYYAKTKTESLLPVIFFIYGGGWKSGNKQDYRFVADAFVQRGYMVVIADYSKYPEVVFPAFVEDAALAFDWTHQHIAAYGGDARNIFVLGHSAGAHIGALLASDASYLSRYNLERAEIRAFSGLAGPYSFTPDEPDYEAIFGPPARYPLMKIPTFIDGKEPPMLLLHGDADDDVKMSNLLLLKRAILQHHGKVETKIYRGVDHIEIVGALSQLWRDKAPVLDDIDHFFKQHMQ